VQKAQNAQAAGAVAMIVADSTDATAGNMGGTDPAMTIPSVHVSRGAGQAIREGLPATGRVADNPDSDFYSPLSISGRFISSPAQHGDWPNFDYDKARQVNVAVYDALQQRGNSPFGKVTLYPQNTNLPGTALGSFQLRGSAVILFETSGQPAARAEAHGHADPPGRAERTRRRRRRRLGVGDQRHRSEQIPIRTSAPTG
jgi:hypothetical protein